MTMTVEGARIGRSAPLDVAMGDRPGHHQRADTVQADVPGLVTANLAALTPRWPLVDALAVPYGIGQPLTWLVEPPVTERPALEKSQLAGQTVKVAASMGTPLTIASWTDISRQANSSPSVRGSVEALLATVVAGDADRYLAETLTTGLTAAANLAAALASLVRWPGPRLIVLGTSGFTESVRWVNEYADASGGAFQVLADPYITQSLVMATTGVAVGVVGPSALFAENPSKAGIDVSSAVTLAVAAAVGAVATWTIT